MHKLWETYARYLHMPRLANRDVLNNAIANRASTITWQQDTFAYAEAHDGERWVGLHTDTAVAPAPSGLLIRPDKSQSPPGSPNRRPARHLRAGDPPGPPGGDPESDPTPVLPTDFYAQFHLDLLRGIKQLHEIIENVGTKLGDPDVEMVLEIRAKTSRASTSPPSGPSQRTPAT